MLVGAFAGLLCKLTWRGLTPEVRAAREDRFQLETPSGEEGRYDITRTDAHHRVLFGMAR